MILDTDQVEPLPFRGEHLLHDLRVIGRCRHNRDPKPGVAGLISRGCHACSVRPGWAAARDDAVSRLVVRLCGCAAVLQNHPLRTDGRASESWAAEIPWCAMLCA
jgi:hypothetical protein